MSNLTYPENRLCCVGQHSWVRKFIDYELAIKSGKNAGAGMKFYRQLGSALAIGLAAATAVSAQSVEIQGTTTGAPLWNRPVGMGPALSGVGTAVPYASHLITIVDALAFSARVTAFGGADSYLFLYQGAFDALQPLAGLVAANDDSSGSLLSVINSTNGPFAEGEYTIVVTGFANSNFGAYTLLLNGAVVGWGLATSEQLAELQGIVAQSGRQTLRVLTGNIASAAREGMASRDISFSTKGAEGLPGKNMFVWAKISNSNATGGGRSLSMPLAQFGADWALDNNLILGFSIAGSDIAASSGEARLSASEVLLQPYLGWTAGDYYGMGSLVLGRIDYDEITTSGGTASAKGDMKAATFEISRDFTLANGGIVSPLAAIRAGSIKLTETGGSLAAAGVDDSVWFNELSLGATYSAMVGPGRASVSLAADYFDTDAPIDLASGSFDQTGWSATFGLGYDATLGNGLVLKGSLSASGLGTDTRNNQGSLTLGWSF